MAHFAKVENRIIVDVICFSNEIFGNDAIDFPESELLGQEYISNNLKLDGEWLQTSYSGSFRQYYAGLGYSYHPEIGEHGVFIPVKPFPSWQLDDEMVWRPPVRYPIDSEENLIWDEEIQNWIPLNQ